jgi:hypothetical protein
MTTDITNLSDRLLIIFLALATLHPDLLAADFLTVSDVLRALDIECDTADLGQLADLGMYPATGDAGNLEGYGETGCSLDPTLCKVGDLYSAVFLLTEGNHLPEKKANLGPRQYFARDTFEPHCIG